MKKLTFKFLPSKKNVVNGIAPITLRITLDRKSTYLSLGKTYSINVKDWDYKKDIPKRTTNYDLLTHNLKKYEMIVNNEILRITTKSVEYSLKAIRDEIKIKLDNADEEVDAILDNNVIEVDFLTYFQKNRRPEKGNGEIRDI